MTADKLARPVVGLLLVLAGVVAPASQPAMQAQLMGGVRVIVHRPVGRMKASVMVLHSIFENEQSALPLAQALARNGYLAVNVRLQGGRSFAQYMTELQAIYRRLARDGPVLLVGHSMGADLACALASQEPRIRATVALGFPVRLGRTDPRNVLLGVGAWDQLHPREDMLGALARTTGVSRPQPKHLYGSFAAGTARELVVSSTCDHSMENFDPILFRATVAWFNRALGSQPSPNGGAREDNHRVDPIRVAVPDPFLRWGLFWLGCLVLSWWLLEGLRARLQGRWLALAVTLVVAGLGLVHRQIGGRRLELVMVALVLGLVLTNGLSRDKGRAGSVRAFVCYAGSLWLALGAGMALHSSGWIWHRPRLLLGLPVCMLSAIPVYLMKGLSGLITMVPGTSGIHPVLGCLLLAEALFPGRLFQLVARPLGRLPERLRRLRFGGMGRISRNSVAALTVCLMAAGVAWYQVLRAGYVLGTADVWGIAKVFLELAGVPSLLWVAVLRSQPFQAAVGATVPVTREP